MWCRKKPVVVEAVQYTGQNKKEISAFCGGAMFINRQGLHIRTLEGVHTAAVGDYIIKGVAGEVYPCKPSIFAQTYEFLGDTYSA